MMVVHLVFQISTCRRRNHVFIKSFTNSTFVLQSILFVNMISDSLSSYRSQIGNHAHLRPRDYKLADKCVFSLIPIFLLKLSAREYLATGPARKNLAPVANKGSHSIYFFIHKPTPQQWQKIKGCKRNKQNTHARRIRMLKRRLSHSKGAYKLQQMSQHGKIKGCLSEYTSPNFSCTKTNGAISA